MIHKQSSYGWTLTEHPVLVSRAVRMGEPSVLLLLAAPLVYCVGLQGRQLVVTMVPSSPYYTLVQDTDDTDTARCRHREQQLKRTLFSFSMASESANSNCAGARVS